MVQKEKKFEIYTMKGTKWHTFHNKKDLSCYMFANSYLYTIYPYFKSIYAKDWLPTVKEQDKRLIM